MTTSNSNNFKLYNVFEIDAIQMVSPLMVTQHLRGIHVLFPTPGTYPFVIDIMDGNFNRFILLRIAEERNLLLNVLFLLTTLKQEVRQIEQFSG